MCIISGSALEEQRSSKCRQSSRKPLLSLQLRAAVILVDNDRCILHQTCRRAVKKQNHPACCLKSVASARLLPAHRRSPLWWPGRELSPLTWCWRFKYSASALGKGRIVPRNLKPPLMNIIPSQFARCNRWHIGWSVFVRSTTSLHRLRRGCVNTPKFVLNATVNVFLS